MCGVNNVCQSYRNEECQTRDIHTCRECMCMQKVALDIENLNTHISDLHCHGIFI